MDESSTTSDTLDQADDDILTNTVADDAIEAAGGAVRLGRSYVHETHGPFLLAAADPWLSASASDGSLPMTDENEE